MIDWDALVIGPAVAIFGETVAYTPQSGETMAITGVFDEAYKPLLPLGGSMGREPLDIGMTGDTVSAGPVLGVRLADFPVPPAQGDALVVRGTAFVVREVQADGHGAVKLLLNEAGP